MNRIRKKFFKPFLDQKRVTLRTSSMSRRRMVTSLNKVGEVYGVSVQQDGQVIKRPPATADTKKRKIAKFKGTQLQQLSRSFILI